MAQAAFSRQRAARRLMRLALALAVIVVFASSYLRLRGNGLGCQPWPGCYGTAQALEQAGRDPIAHALRLAHRVAASLFLLVALAAVLLGWKHWRSFERAQAIVLLLVTLALAAIGRLTPSAMPWVTWANVLGGFALIALALGLAGRGDGDPITDGLRRFIAFLSLLLVLQVLGGTLLSVRLTAAECSPACAHAPGGDLLALWNGMRAGDAATVGRAAGSAALLQGLHRIGGLALALVALAVAAAGAPHPRALALAACAVPALGFASTHAASAVVGAAHALAAAGLLAVLTAHRARVRLG